MLQLFRDSFQNQTGAAIRTVEEIVRAWPDEQWHQREHPEGPVWAVAYHAGFYLHFYLSDSEDAFTPHPLHRPGLHAPVEAAKMDEPLTREQVLEYLGQVRRFVAERVAGWSEAELAAPSPFPWLPMTRAESLLYNLRHVGYHGAQLNARLKELTGSAIPWVGTEPLAGE